MTDPYQPTTPTWQQTPHQPYPDPYTYAPPTDYPAPTAPPPTGRQSVSVPRWALLVAGVVVVAAAAVGVTLAVTHSGGRGASSTFTVQGTFDLQAGYGERTFGPSCTGLDGYSDLGPGAPVVIYNSSGTSVALGTLGDGTEPGAVDVCEFTFTVTGVPAGQGPYFVEVSHRGRIAFNQADAGHLALSIGSD